MQNSAEQTFSVAEIGEIAENRPDVSTGPKPDAALEINGLPNRTGHQLRSKRGISATERGIRTGHQLRSGRYGTEGDGQRQPHSPPGSRGAGDSADSADAHHEARVPPRRQTAGRAPARRGCARDACRLLWRAQRRSGSGAWRAVRVEAGTSASFGCTLWKKRTQSPAVPNP